MAFYKTNNQEITQTEEWINLFQPYYYLDGPINGKRINRRNQGSRFVENEIEKILKRNLQSNDLPLIIAWKIGAINHQISEYQQTINYKNNFDQNFQLQGRYGLINAGETVHYCQNNFEELILNNNTEKIFDLLYRNRGANNKFGLVYCLALLYFFTQGKWPIYDKYAHIALDAILLNRQPGELICYTQINSWRDYCEKYVDKIKNIFGVQNIPRNIDRSLWVYGHFYESN
ncbi:MAG: hypothetical protein ABII25_00815 [bacterium]